MSVLLPHLTANSEHAFTAPLPTDAYARTGAHGAPRMHNSRISAVVRAAVTNSLQASGCCYDAR